MKGKIVKIVSKLGLVQTSNFRQVKSYQIAEIHHKSNV